MRLSALMSYFPKKSHYGLEDAVYRAFLQAYCLHPNRYVARRVVLEAMPYLTAVELPRHRQRPQAAMPYRRFYPPQVLSQASLLWELLQISIFEVSELWEIDQEAPRPQREPEYRPTAPVMLTRFVKHLAFITMVRADSYPMAVAFGSCLYTCAPEQACAVVDLSDQARLHNIKRVRTAQILHHCTTRFRHVLGHHGIPPNGASDDEHEVEIPTKEASDDEREVVEDAMGACAPWSTQCFQEPPDVLGQLLNVPSERQRMHALLCTDCAGFPKLVRQWNATASPPLPQTMEIPVLLPLSASSNADNDSDPPANAKDHFDPPIPDDFLNDLRISITNILKAAAPRRRAQSFELLRICADGAELGRFGGASQTTQDFCIPADTFRVQIFGQDQEGDVPLSVFYLPEPEDDHAREPLYHVTESGATLALTVLLMDTAETYQVQLTFWPEESLVPKTAAWYEAAVATACRSLELAQLTGDTALETDMRQRLRGLYQSMSASSAQGGEQAASLGNLLHWTSELLESLSRWMSELWSPAWAGAVVTAADIPEESQTFYLEHGEITVTCDWRAADQGTPASIHLSWQADLGSVCDLWVQFRHPATEAVLAEVRLGTELSGAGNFTQAMLGFDPSQERWGLAVMLKETAS